MNNRFNTKLKPMSRGVPHFMVCLIGWIKGFFRRDPVKLVIVRRYQDANGSYVGELYMYEIVHRKYDTIKGYRMIGVSLDTLPLDIMDRNKHTDHERESFHLDTLNDFLAPIPGDTVRVGALDPIENDSVRQMMASLPRCRMFLFVQNRFIERVLSKE